MLILFYAVLLIPVIGPSIIALALIGLALGGTGPGRALTAKERKEAVEASARNNAKYLASREYLEGKAALEALKRGQG
jgi:hypothetical protein